MLCCVEKYFANVVLGSAAWPNAVETKLRPHKKADSLQGPCRLENQIIFYRASLLETGTGDFQCITQTVECAKWFNIN